jgi:uncharacterized membrane protein YqaE (UPF0057 family)
VAAIAKNRKEELEQRKFQSILDNPNLNAEERQYLLGIKKEEAKKSFSCVNFIYNVLLIYLAIFFPPFCVLIVKGCSKTLLLNLILTCFFYIPGTYCI